jgi:radical SAM protein with 4Fe4S-binding SPASM domain
VHCYNYWRDKSELALVGDLPPANMTMDTAKRMLEQCVKNELFDVVLTGGEPFLNFPVVKWLAEEFIKNKIRVSINSNLSLITDEQADWVLETPLFAVLTTVLGPNADVHDAITTEKGSFDATMRGINKLLKHGRCPGVNCVVSKMNIDHIEQICQVLVNVGLKAMVFTPAICPEYCKDFTPLQLTNQEVVKFLNTALAARKKYGIRVGTLVTLPLCSLDGVEDILYFSDKSCGIGRKQIVCSSDGKLRPCTHFETIEGDLVQEELANIWSRFEHWLEASNFPDICLNCKLFGLCSGGCRMSAKSATGNHCAVDPNINVENIDKVARQIQEQLKMKQKASLETLPDSFVINNYRTRKEEYGVVIGTVSGPLATAIISDEALQVLKRFEVGKSYFTHDVLQDLSPMDKNNFLAGMAHRKILQFV